MLFAQKTLVFIVQNVESMQVYAKCIAILRKLL